MRKILLTFGIALALTFGIVGALSYTTAPAHADCDNCN
jgi:hypothetical protein